MIAFRVLRTDFLLYKLGVSVVAESDLSDKETVVHPDQLESSSLALRFRLRPDVLHNGKVTLKCVATINHTSAVTTREITASGKLSFLLTSS
ncbi:uncharacterized protein CDAR_41671 [Caerostris darwini]|uniref:Uncharacterized protein n=1 Tax=Caerostris darwini TaxID=1538125 RepID=A0AAV4NED6_9ARAC|nr:uncharacterized protein CDAR_41671 [Caerostris darwini]